jgi:hypothetical protein
LSPRHCEHLGSSRSAPRSSFNDHAITNSGAFGPPGRIASSFPRLILRRPIQPVAHEQAFPWPARPPAASFLQPNRTGGVLTEQGALADVTAKHRRALVARLFGDDALGDPGRSSRGRKAGPQRVTCHLAGVEPGTGRVALQHERHRRSAETCRADVAMAVHGTKGGSVCDARDFEPRAPGADRAGNRVRPVWDADGAPGALLVRLRVPEADGEPVGSFCDVCPSTIARGIDQTMTSVLRRLNRSRLALACIAVLGLVTAVAAIAAVVWNFHSNLNFAGRAPLYGYVAYVAEGLATVIPALACLVIAARAWARGSYLLRADEPDPAYEDEPEQPAEPEAVP